MEGKNFGSTDLGGKNFGLSQKFPTIIIFVIFWTGGKNSLNYFEQKYGKIGWYFCSSIPIFLEFYWKFDIEINTYSMKQPDLYYSETIKMTSQAWPNFVWRIRAAGECSLWTLTRLVTLFAWFQNSIDKAVS